MKERYKEAELEIVLLKATDLIQTSGNYDDEDDVSDNDWT